MNEAAAASPVQPIVNMGQGFFGYNPPPFVIDAAKQALDKVDCNQYSPTKVVSIGLEIMEMLMFCRGGHDSRKHWLTHTHLSLDEP